MPRSRLRAAAVLATAAVALGFAACGPLGGGDDGSGDAVAGPGPDEVVQAFLDARVADDCDEYSSYYTEAKAALGNCFGAPLDAEESDPQVGEAVIDGESATVPVTFRYDCTPYGAGDPVHYDDTYLLVVEDGAWRIDEIDLAGVTDDDCISHNSG